MEYERHARTNQIPAGEDNIVHSMVILRSNGGEILEPIIGKSYYIEPDGSLREVDDAMHSVFARNYIKYHHDDILLAYARNLNLMPFEGRDHAKDLITGELGWITFAPLGDNAHVCDVGRNAKGEFSQVRFTKKQISMLILLWEINHNKLEKLERIFSQNEKYGKRLHFI